MKKILAFAMATAMVLSLAACGNNNGATRHGVQPHRLLHRGLQVSASVIILPWSCAHRRKMPNNMGFKSRRLSLPAVTSASSASKTFR